MNIVICVCESCCTYGWLIYMCPFICGLYVRHMNERLQSAEAYYCRRSVLRTSVLSHTWTYWQTYTPTQSLTLFCIQTPTPLDTHAMNKSHISSRSAASLDAIPRFAYLSFVHTYLSFVCMKQESMYEAREYVWSKETYGVPTINRLLNIIVLFCRI